MKNKKTLKTEAAAAKLLYSKYPAHSPQDSGYWKDMFIEGAKWQQERSFSKEEVLKHLNHLLLMPSSELDKFSDDEGMVTMKWFKQF